MLSIRRGPPRRIELDANSWVDWVDGFAVNASDAFETIHDETAWQTTAVLRYDRYVEEQRLSAGLRTGSSTLLRQTDLQLRSRYRSEFSGTAAILYRDGNDFQGLHSDREMRWLDNTLVAIVVLGERRPFVLRPRVRWLDAVDRPVPGDGPGDVTLLPGDGDLLVMGGRCQRDWLHGVPKVATKLPRISLTWRWTSKTGPPDTNPTYYDGRHFSDGPRQPSTRRRPAR